MKITLRDIADRVGVSAGVASTVLSGKKNGIGVSLATRLKVREAARELGYVLPARAVIETKVRRHGTDSDDPAPNASGAPVVVGVVGVLCDYRRPDDFWQRSTLNSIEGVLADSGVVSRFAGLDSGDGTEAFLEARAGELLVGGAARGIVIIDLHDTLGADPITRTVGRIVSAGVPVVCVTIRELPAPVPNIVSDQFASGTLAALHLLERGGDRRIDFFAPFDTEWEATRVAGARAGARIAGLGEDAVSVWDKARVARQSAEVPMSEWLRRFDEAAHRFVAEYMIPACTARHVGSAPLSVIASSDLAASGCIRHAAHAGFRAGRDFLIIGFDDAPESRRSGLTSLHPPLTEMGEEAGRILLRLMAGERTNPQIRMRSRVIARDSTVLQDR